MYPRLNRNGNKCVDLEAPDSLKQPDVEYVERWVNQVYGKIFLFLQNKWLGMLTKHHGDIIESRMPK